MLSQGAIRVLGRRFVVSEVFVADSSKLVMRVIQNGKSVARKRFKRVFDYRLLTGRLSKKARRGPATLRLVFKHRGRHLRLERPLRIPNDPFRGA